GADSASHEDAGEWSLDQSVQIFRAVTRRCPGGPIAGQDDLTTMRVAAEDKPDARVGDLFDIIGVVREDDRGVVAGRVAEGRIEVVCVSTELPPAAEREPAPASAQPDPLIRELVDP